ncbi:FeoA family protein [Bacillus sp. 1P06AnD]|uniref:FeoA family protein n=1 Tax=Bacillus sp. 1P06AnD TaxID=3132208 RepID=UPI0039A3A4E5
MKLHGIKPGCLVTVINLSDVDSLLQKRLSSFGIREGCQVCMKQKGLFSGACVVECEGQQIGLRKKDLLNIEVQAV